MDSRIAFTVLQPVSQGQIPQVSASAEDPGSESGHAELLLSLSRTGREKNFSTRRNTVAYAAGSWWFLGNSLGKVRAVKGICSPWD